MCSWLHLLEPFCCAFHVGSERSRWCVWTSGPPGANGIFWITWISWISWKQGTAGLTILVKDFNPKDVNSVSDAAIEGNECLHVQATLDYSLKIKLS